LAAPPDGRTAVISGGVLSSFPAQNGQKPPSCVAVSLSAKSSGRRLRSLAMITQRLASGS